MRALALALCALATARDDPRLERAQVVDRVCIGRPEGDRERKLAMHQVGSGLSSADHHEEALSVKEALVITMRRLGDPEDHILCVQNNLAIRRRPRRRVMRRRGAATSQPEVERRAPQDRVGFVMRSLV